MSMEKAMTLCDMGSFLSAHLLKLVQMLQPGQYHLLAGLGDLASQEYFVEDSIDLQWYISTRILTHPSRLYNPPYKS